MLIGTDYQCKMRLDMVFFLESSDPVLSLGEHQSDTIVDSTIGQSHWNSLFYFGQMSVPIGLIAFVH
jgi:hypothetical protein